MSVIARLWYPFFFSRFSPLTRTFLGRKGGATILRVGRARIEDIIKLDGVLMQKNWLFDTMKAMSG
jgi:hypothetical protein